MHALEYVWNLGDRFDATALRKRVVDRKSLYENLPGLISKAFLLDETLRRFGGFYIWRGAQDADLFLQSEIFAASRAAMGEPEIRRYEVPAYIGPAARDMGMHGEGLTH
jgi:hypothetical protein